MIRETPAKPTFAKTLTASLLLCLAGIAGCGEEGDDPAFLMEQQLENDPIVRVVTGSYSGTLTQMGGEMGAVLDADDLRVVPVIGQGSAQGIRDLLYVDGVDVAMFTSFMVEYGRRNNLHGGVNLDGIEYIAALFPQYMHLIVRDNIQSVQDLEGRRVNVGPVTNAAALVAQLVFNDLGLQIEIVNEPHSTGFAMLQNGEIDGLVRLGGQPQSLFDGVDETSGLRFLSVTPDDLPSRVFEAGSLRSDAYPGLIDDGTEVPTLATRAILAVYNPTGAHPRAERIDRFVKGLFDNFGTLQNPDEFSPSWLEVDLEREVPGMNRYQAAAELLTP